jgi:hypothetical protein
MTSFAGWVRCSASTSSTGSGFFSAGVQALGPNFTWAALSATFDRFCEDNDPYGEHDFGAFELESQRVFLKIDYLQRGTQFGAEDPADNGRTCRVMTIMLAEEY